MIRPDYGKIEEHERLVIPNAFPSPLTSEDGITGLHDIVGGYVPDPKELGVLMAGGWLRIAMPAPNSPAYIDPSLEEEVKGRIESGNRLSERVDLWVGRSYLVDRREFDGADRDFVELKALEPPAMERDHYIDHHSWTQYAAEGIQAVPFEGRKLESAMYFDGTVEFTDGLERYVQGIHFRSGHEKGWVKLSDTLSEREAKWSGNSTEDLRRDILVD